MDAAAAVRLFLLERWYGEGQPSDEKTEVMWGRCLPQTDDWSCGHRIVLCFEHLASQGCFYINSTVEVQKCMLDEQVFSPLASQQEFVERDHGILHVDLGTPIRRRHKRTNRSIQDLSPPPVRQRPQRSSASKAGWLRVAVVVVRASNNYCNISIHFIYFHIISYENIYTYIYIHN